MTFSDDLLRKGYLPEGVPPFFQTAHIADHLKAQNPSGYLTKHTDRLRASSYSASKRGMTRRPFSVIHPATAFDVARFLATRRTDIEGIFAQSQFSLSVPQHTPSSDRAVSISTHSQLEEQRLSRLAGYRFVAKTDISRFYHSIYTHSIPWAVHGKSAAKADRSPTSSSVWCNRLDQIVRLGQDGQTIGIPVGPDSSRYLAELVCTAIDQEFVKRCDVARYAVVRHVDDIFIGAHSHAEAERALWRYREAIREFELDINESKTRIHSSDFKFADSWPSDVAGKLRFAMRSATRKRDRMRAALEDIFSVGVSTGDDGVLKYAIRSLDSSEIGLTEWTTIEPFLKRCAVHFGHTIDFVARVLVWCDLAGVEELDKKSWAPILQDILDRHGRLGNDSEVCWGIYSCFRLGIEIPHATAEAITHNCNALSVLVLLNCVDRNLVSTAIFSIARERLKLEDSRGPFWPLMLEWVSRQWPQFDKIQPKLKDDLIEGMASNSVSLFDEGGLPKVFEGIDESEFSSVRSAIEKSESYDADNDDEATP